MNPVFLHRHIEAFRKGSDEINHVVHFVISPDIDVLRNLFHFGGDENLVLEYPVEKHLHTELQPYLDKELDFEQYDYFLSCELEPNAAPNQQTIYPEPVSKQIQREREAGDFFFDLEERTDVYAIDFKHATRLFADFCQEELLSGEMLQHFKVDPSIHILCDFFVEQTLDYLRGDVSGAELTRLRGVSCDIMDSLDENSNEWLLLDAITSLLYDDEDSYVQELFFEDYYYRLIGINPDLCAQFTDYVISMMNRNG